MQALWNEVEKQLWVSMLRRLAAGPGDGGGELMCGSEVSDKSGPGGKVTCLQWGWGEAFQAEVGGAWEVSAHSDHVRIDKTCGDVVCQHSPCPEVVGSSCEILA